MARLFRYWMTGCLAVVAAAMAGAGPLAAAERHVTSRASRYDVAETIERIEARAHVHGLKLFARLAAPSAIMSASTSVSASVSRRPGAGTSRITADSAADGAVIVFESARGGTPVLMAQDRSRPSVPLSLIVRRNADGHTEVVMAEAEWEGLPADVASDMTHLPQMIDEALG